MLRILPIACCYWSFPMPLIPKVQFKWTWFWHFAFSPFPAPTFSFCPSKELVTDGVISCWGWKMGASIMYMSSVDKWKFAHCMWIWAKIISITYMTTKSVCSPASNINIFRSIIEPWCAWNTNGIDKVGYKFNPPVQFDNGQIGTSSCIPTRCDPIKRESESKFKFLNRLITRKNALIRGLERNIQPR